ncbi:P-loop ATPase, Sll1717 family [Pseudobacteroides cellulosolvens]|uniref:Uncharacterized protein n=1 Tax=Pseudobacteroides cellulosolvens ATCC 35603 = DSM 2933 TaxID=398512 RepID=A0A0L6JXF2_9FIRM|nr:ATP-binding protein [Pseudobacteroides cellulosolvens]KNY30533.1 hypothetical protein Bccel_5813 [Pseudobacteroides cellulosolvens ATCC 35603 = DSM 2933]KNY30538.1 hypothetical protein Bccel_5818 [Pseudobacteroides cellulosolvens ATCC 35603 = DSM 2933]
MPELYKNLGFRENPFSRFSAEEEVDYLSEIYLPPRYFQTLVTDLANGSSRFIFGERGSGKSALILELQRELSNKNVLSIIIDNYDSVPLDKNDRYLILLIIKNIIKNYVVSLSKNPQLLKVLDKYDKEKLAIFIKDFYNSISKREFENAYNKVTRYKSKNFLKNIFNNFLNKPINIAISSSLEIGSDAICKALNLPKNYSQDFYKNYLPKLGIEELSQCEKEKQFLENYTLLKDILLELVTLVKKSGFKNTVVFFDRIDEFRALDGRINRIADFTEQILKDTDLLYFKELSIVFSIWTEVKLKLNEKGVRFDKFKPIDISWTDSDISTILQKRLDYFSLVKPFNINNLIEDNNDINYLIDLAHKSPRDLIRLFSTVYDEQSIANSNSYKFDSANIIKAKIKFCKEYDYYSLFPSKRGTKEDIISIINKILRVGKVHFKSTDLVSEFKFSTQSANNYIKIMKDYGLIIDNDQVVGGAKEFIVIDPKIVFLIKNNIKMLRDIA